MLVATAVVYTGLPTAAFAAVEAPPTESSLQNAVTDDPAELTPGEGGAETPTPGDDGGETVTPETPAEGGAETPTTPEPEAPVDEPEQTDAPNAPAAPAPLAAPLAAAPNLNGGPGTASNPADKQIIINVSALSDRTGSTTVAGLSGATYSAYEATSLTDQTQTTPTATCTTDANGQCWMKVPTRGSKSSSAGYLVKADTAPTGWELLPRLVTDNSYSVATQNYSFYTGAANSKNSAGARTIAVPGSKSNGTRTSAGNWATARANPQLDPVCGIDVALLVDLSGSVKNAGAVQQVRDASSAVVNALAGTPSNIALHTFGNTSPAAGNSNANMSLRSVATQEEATFVLNKAQGLTAPGTGEATNWDRGLWGLNPMASAGELDLVIMITDGMPTTYAGGTQDGDVTGFITMENSIASANAIKSHGVGIIAVGVGGGISGAAENLRAISGPVAGQDFYQVKNWDDLAAQMKALSSKNCEGTVNVVKQVIPVGGTVADAEPRANWGFTATAPTPSVRTDVKGSTFSTSAQGVTGSTGALGFRSSFEGTSQAGRKLSITESLTGQYSIVPQDGQNAVCTRTDTKKPVPVTNTGTAANPGFTVDPIQNATVSCVVYNQTQDLSAKLRVDKVWKIDADGDGTFEETTDPNAAPKSIPGLSA